MITASKNFKSIYGHLTQAFNTTVEWFNFLQTAWTEHIQTFTRMNASEEIVKMVTDD